MSDYIEGPKQVVFVYGGNDKDKDVDVDLLGDLPYYQVGEIVERRGKSWKITQVLVRQAIFGPDTLSTHTVSVTDKF